MNLQLYLFNVNRFNNFKGFLRALPVFLLMIFTWGCSMDTEPKKLSFLHTKGQSIVDESGREVIIRSVGLGNWMLPEGYMWKFGNDADRPRKIEKVVSDLIGEEQAAVFWKSFRANYITEADIARIKAVGFNTVRIALNSRLFITEGNNPVMVDEGFILLDNLIAWCTKHQVYVIIDMHGAPGGQTGQNIDDSPNDLPELFTDAKNQESLLKLWLAIAEKYKDNPTVAAYDLLNEPLPGVTGAAAKYKHLLEPLYIRLTTEIRKIDTKHMITVEGYDWSNNWSIFKKPFDDNMFYQFHYYCWSNPTNLYNVGYFIAKRDSLGAPIWVGETGEKDNTIYFGTTQYFEKNNIGWSFWPWKKMDTHNTPYSINKPDNWDLIAGYTRGERKPGADTALMAFNQLLENIKLNNCVYFEDVTNAVFRRLPLKIEAENYLHGQWNQTWMVNDTLQKSKYYRTSEFVPIELLATDTTKHKRRWDTEQCVVLKKNEWVSYKVDVLKEGEFTIKVKMGNSQKNAEAMLTLGTNNLKLASNEAEWAEIDAGKIKLMSGEQIITIKAESDELKIDWIDIR